MHDYTNLVIFVDIHGLVGIVSSCLQILHSHTQIYRVLPSLSTQYVHITSEHRDILQGARGWIRG